MGDLSVLEEALACAKTFYPREACRLMATDKGLLDLRAEGVATFLNRLPEGLTVGLYGCGELGRHLARGHGQSLGRLRVVFLTTSDDGQDGFEGYPKLLAKDILAAPPERVVLLSAAYERGMLDQLRNMDRARVHTLPEVMRSIMTDEILAAVARPVAEAVEHLAGELGPALAKAEKSVCFLLLGFGHNMLATLGELRRRGFFVSALATIHSDQPMPEEELKAQGYVDHFFAAPSMEFLHVLLTLLLRRVRFDLTDCWITLSNAEFVRALAESGRTRVVVTYDDFLPLLLENQDYAQRYCELVETTPERALDTQRAVFTGAGGIIYKDSPEVPRMLARRFGHAPRTRHRFPALSEAVFQALPKARKYSEDDGRVHVVFAHSLHQDPVFITYFDYRTIFHTVKRLTSAGVHFTVFNNLDVNGSGYEDFVRLSEENPLFDYRFHVDFHELLELLPRFDFGWASYRFVDHNGFKAYATNSLGLKIFTYAGAGLPVLVSPELEYMHKLVLEKGIGLSLAYEDWPRLPEIAARADQAALTRNMAALRRELSLENQLPRLADFYEEVLAQGRGDENPGPRRETERTT